MKQSFLFILFFGVCISSSGWAQDTQQERLRRHVYTLAADSLNGRQAGTADAARARAYIAARWQEMGLKPLSGVSELWDDSYEMPFEVGGEKGYCNLVAFIEGGDPVLKEEYIVVGGHYDHLGVKHGEVYNGADDNASGSACVIEVARQLLARQKELKRSVVICAFDAEEMGLYGSRALASAMEKNGTVKHVRLMMSIDMVGWYKQGGGLTLQGTGTLADADKLTDAQACGIDINIRRKKFENSVFTATDTEPFARLGVPTLAVTTGLKSPYHKPGDDAELIDYEGLDRVTDYMAAFILLASQQQGNLASGRVAAKHRQSPNRFMAGFVVGTNTGHVQPVGAAAEPLSLPGWTGGVQMQYNINKNWAVHTGVLYGYTRQRMPLAEDAFGQGYRIRQGSITVPLRVQVGVYGSGLNLYLRAGGYFNRLLFGNSYAEGDPPATMPDFQVPSPYRGGLTWGWGFHLGSITFDMDSYYQIGGLFDTSAGLPDATGSNLTVTIGYFF